MAVEKPVLRWTAPASTDLSEDQYKLVKFTETGELALAGAGDKAFSLVEPAKQGVHGTVILEGITKAIASAEIKAGEYVSANSEGLLVKATTQVVTSKEVTTVGTHVIGIALSKVTAKGDFCSYVTATGLA